MNIGSNLINFMKSIRTYLTLLLGSSIVFMLGSCEQGDEYYAEYQNESKVYPGTVLDYLESQNGVYDSLLLVLDRLPALRDSLKNESKQLTLFAITNRSFALAVDALNTTRKLTNKTPLYLEDVKRNELDSLMSRYIFSLELSAANLKPFIDGQTIKSVQYGYEMHAQYRVLNASGMVGGGQQQILFSDVNNSIFQRYWQRINTSAVDIRTQNGIIHVLTAGHDFGFNKFTSKFSQ